MLDKLLILGYLANIRRRSLANGKETELALFRALEEAGFVLAPYSRELDEVYRVDRVVLRPPRRQEYFFPSPMGVQVTLRSRDWAKRAEFVEMARGVADRLVYIELIEKDIARCADALHAALAHLFYDSDAPARSLITLNTNRYRVDDLDRCLIGYRRWLNTPLKGSLNGVVTKWIRDERYGFIEGGASVTPHEDEDPMMFFHLSDVADDRLKERLNQYDGELSSPIPVAFEDLGRVRPEHWRKVATRVSGADVVAMPVPED
ncbi:MAG: hypothetical protein Q7S89_01330 [bacterium]|nr:hypothetical protein [bacterium]